MQTPKSSPLDHIRVVLSHTSHPGNIGSTARAMKTMGLSRLYLVNPKFFPDPQAETLASGAVDLLEGAIVVDRLEDALAGCTQVVALSARRRELTVPVQNPRELAPVLIKEARRGADVAIVFGTEMSGLTNEEVRQCNRVVSIPANPEYSSLNLAQAVQVIAYELRMAVDTDLEHLQERHELASHDDIERMYAHMETALIDIGFLNPRYPKRLMPRLRRLFGRIQLEKVEVDILRGMLRAAVEPPAGRRVVAMPGDEEKSGSAE
ncbi:RNA methyltransferase [Parachitinimonas caeni]|uniref:tRNA (cytidine/uridine-2'-O-)-methyltransferase TrmJ n=1 Tax=Parachitinimonas caeni TaxID=3031301 RepID=A0ABT7E088_9NEIS|nr:RNA methyltransferase [Parachitinimonas caeni]MDK2125720.1 RNA methyltransferase [Parachitinimonas caeni]